MVVAFGYTLPHQGLPPSAGSLWTDVVVVVFLFSIICTCRMLPTEALLVIAVATFLAHSSTISVTQRLVAVRTSIAPLVATVAAWPATSRGTHRVAVVVCGPQATTWAVVAAQIAASVLTGIERLIWLIVGWPGRRGSFLFFWFSWRRIVHVVRVIWARVVPVVPVPVVRRPHILLLWLAGNRASRRTSTSIFGPHVVWPSSIIATTSYVGLIYCPGVNDPRLLRVCLDTDANQCPQQVCLQVHVA